MLRILAAWMTILILMAFAPSTNRLSAADEPAAPATSKHVAKHGRGALALLQLEKVKADLMLSSDQASQIQKITNDVQKASEAMRVQFEAVGADERKAKLEEMRVKLEEQRKEIAQKITAILTAEQRDRLKQIYLQVHGPAALNQTSVADELKLTDEQRQKLKEIRDAAAKEIRGMAESAPSSAELASLRDKMKSVGKDSSAKAIAVLTDEQRSQFEKMQGKKLDLD